MCVCVCLCICAYINTHTHIGGIGAGDEVFMIVCTRKQNRITIKPKSFSSSQISIHFLSHPSSSVLSQLSIISKLHGDLYILLCVYQDSYSGNIRQVVPYSTSTGYSSLSIKSHLNFVSKCFEVSLVSRVSAILLWVQPKGKFSQQCSV